MSSDQQGEKWEFWVDRGGTFTDIIAKSPRGELLTHKLLSDNPQFYSDAVLEGIRNILKIDKNHKITSDIIEAVKMGSTVATNALLERKGEPTVLVITQGLKDALRIAYQNRPELFAKHIILPDPLYQSVIEAEERVNVQGEVLIPLNKKKINNELKQAIEKNIQSISVVLMHSYRFPEHEIQIGKMAEELGFKQISLSHQVSPLIKLVSRGETTVLDAYLSPTLNRYIHKVSNALDRSKLFFMQSNGGLTKAEAFQGKDSLLSGPAAGVIGGIEVAKRAGFQKIITFDMGGTSTDLAHYSGELERTQLAKMSGFLIRSPMMQIHSIASGGGSMVKFHQKRYQVGPESAGADPGPTCYRRDGPLTLTDCNLLLGRIQADYFPKTFGEQGNQRLDKDAVEKKFIRLAKKMADEMKVETSLEKVAAGFLKIAVNNMANAIKKISVERGYDVSEYLLCCFGGAGGQHACSVADELGITKILIHPFAGVLSALGLGLASARLLKEKTIEKKLHPTTLNEIKKIIKALENEACQAMIQQGFLENQLMYEKKLRLRYQGSETSLDVDFSTIDEMKKNFEQKHKKTFGYLMQDKNITVESVLIEAMSRPEQLELDFKISNKKENSLKPIDFVHMYSQGKSQKTPVYDRNLLGVGDKIDGPAMIIEINSTTVVDAGWQAEVTSSNNLLLNKKTIRQKKEIISKKVDPVRLEIFNNLFMFIADQMGVVLSKTAYSVNIKERLDFSCAIFDRRGHLVANAHHIPVHLGSMSESIQIIIRERQGKMHPGDVYLLNDPYHGGTHLPDLTTITPIFYPSYQEAVMFVASRAHQADIGGITPGSIPAQSREIEEEGVLINNFLLVDKGRFCKDELSALLMNAKYPVRNLKQNIADLQAQVAANQKGQQELLNLLDEYGSELVFAYMQHVQDNAESCVRAVINQLHEGKFEYSMDNGAKIAAKITVNQKNQSACIDFSGSSAQMKNNFNAPRAVCYAAVLYVFRLLVNENIPMNQGCLKPLTIRIPDHCLLNPIYPAAIVAGNVETSQCIVDTLLGALKVMAASQGSMNNFTFGNAQYQYYETICGGSGAGPGFHGTSAVHTHMTNSLMTDPEVLELNYPILIDTFSIRKNSGGRGKWRGGDGVIRKIKFLEAMTAAIVSNRRKIPPYGMEGGEAGKVGKNSIIRANGKIELLPSTAQFNVHVGDIIMIETPGGGGYG